MCFFTILFTIFLFIISLCLLIKFRGKKVLQEFPTPPGNFIFGHALLVQSTTSIINITTQYLKKYGSTIKLTVGPDWAPYVVVLLSTDYKFSEFFLSSNTILTKSQNYEFLKPWLGSGLLLSDGVQWKQHRKIITPAFHFEILKEFVSVFESVGNNMIEKLKTFDHSPSVDMYPLVTLCTLDVISETAMGTKINAQNGENSEYVSSVKEMCRIIIDRCLSPLKITNWTFWCTRDYYLQKNSLEILHNFSSNVINNKKQMVNTATKDGAKKKKLAFLDLLLKYSDNEKLLSDEDIREEVDTFMFEGHDTTASGICFTLFLLANHREVQKKVFTEQKDLFGENKNPRITYQDLQDMKYLEMVIKESLRLYPAVPFIGRYTTEDIKYNGGTIPKGTNIVISIYGIHRNPQVFPEPESFNPERFKDFDTSLPYAYIPFSAGSRNCIGQKFAMLELKSIISKIVRNFELIPANPQHDLILAAETVLKSKNGIRMGLKRRI